MSKGFKVGDSMIRKINLKNENEDFKAILYRNRTEKLCEIPNEYISGVNRTLEEIDSFSVTIPKYIQKGVKKIMNPIYLKIQARQHIIVTTKVDDIETKERFILLEPKSNNSKNSGEKTFKAESFETTLKKKRTSFSGNVMQLKKDETHIAEGVMDKFARETGWGIGYVDPKARVEKMSMTEKVNVDIFKNFTKNNITDGSLIFEKDITTTIAQDRPLYISFEYTNLKTYNGDKLLIETPTVYNTITDPLHLNIKIVQAYHYTEAGNRYGIKYVFTLSDNTKVERIAVFLNVIDKNITCENIRLVWETGNVISTENVKYINIESLDGNWYETLRSLQDNFNSIFTFDSYNKLINVVSRESMNNVKPYILSYDNAILDINITENSDYITGYKVTGKNGLSIVSENIYGDDIVRDYSEYIRLGLISESLQSAITRYEVLLRTKQQEWLVIKDNILTENQKQVRIDSEIQSLQQNIKYLKNLLAGYMTANDTTNQARIKSEIDGLEVRLNQCLALRTQYTIAIESYNTELAEITKSIDRETVVDSVGKIFTDENLQELNDIELIGTFEDDYYTNTFSLFNYAKKILAEDIKPQVDFDINCVNLCKVIQNPKGWNYILQIGSLFKLEGVEVKEMIGEDTVRFVGYNYEPSTNTIDNLLFTNKTKKINNLRSLADLGKKTNTTSGLLNSLKPIIDDAKLSNNFAKEVLDNGLDLSAYIAKGRGVSNYIDISEAGIFLYDQSDMNKSIYIGSSLICISVDGFSSSETAISSEGLIGRTIIGEILVGSKLIITSDDGSFYVGNTDEKNGFGLEIRDGGSGNGQKRIFLGTEVDSDGIRRARLRLLSKDGREVVLDENGIIQTSQFLCWDNLSPSYPMRIPYVCDEGVVSNKKILMSLVFEKYRAFERGMSSGGTTTTSSSGGGGTSGSGGGQTSSSGGGGTSSYEGGFNLEVFTGHGSFDNKLATIQMAYYPTDYYINGDINAHGHTLDTDQIRHSHSVIIKNENHSHLVNNHTHQTYDHTHQISAHTHTLDTTHNHQLEYSIHEQNSMCSNVKIYVNDVLVQSGINQNKQVDITSYINKNTTNNIRIETDTNGRITCNIFTKAFVSF